MSTQKTQLEDHLGYTLKTYSFPHWAKFRGDHTNKSCMCNEEGQVIGLILRATDLPIRLRLPGFLKDLVYCCISDNKAIQEIEFEAALPNLEYLDISDCEQLRTLHLPAGFSNLKTLDAHRTKIGYIGNWEGKFPKLKTLDLSYNGLKNFQASQMKHFPALEELFLYDNKLNFSLNVYYKEAEHGKNHLLAAKELEKALNDGEKVANKDYKILLVGDGKTGKSCLVSVLVDGIFLEDWDSTHGISVKTFQKENFPYILKIWDFGGQDIYHATHRLFMQKDTTYLLLWNQATELAKDPYTHDKKRNQKWKNKRAKYWLNYIHFSGRKSPVLMAQTCSDPNNKQVDHPLQNKLKQQYDPTFSYFNQDLHIESKKEAEGGDGGFEDLKYQLKKAIQAIGRDEYLPARWVRIKQELMQTYQPNFVSSPQELLVKTDKYIPKKTYEEIARNFGEEDPQALLENWLVATGVVFYQEGLFGDNIILDQEWAIKAIYVLFERNLDGPYAQIKENNGLFKGGQLHEFWKTKNYTIKEKQLFVSMMLQCQMIFKIPTKTKEPSFEEQAFIAIELLPETDKFRNITNQKLRWKDNKEALIFIRYDYSFWHYGVLQSFIAQTHHYFDIRGVYKHGVLIREAENWAIVEAVKDSILVTIPKQNIKLLYKIRNLFKDIHSSSQQVKEWVSAEGDAFLAMEELQVAQKDNVLQIKASNETYPLVADYQLFLDLDEKEKFEEPSKEVNISEAAKPMAEKTRAAVKKNRNEKKLKRHPYIEEKEPLFPKDEKVSIYFLAANPDDQAVLKTSTEFREIKDKIKKGGKRKRFKLKLPELDLTEDNLITVFAKKPHIFHFAGHGEENGIAIMDSDGNTQWIETDTLTRFFSVVQKVTKVVILNCCYSEKLAAAISSYGIYVVGYNLAIGDTPAVQFAKGFYTALGEGNTFGESYGIGKATMSIKYKDSLDKLEVWKDGKLLDL